MQSKTPKIVGLSAALAALGASAQASANEVVAKGEVTPATREAGSPGAPMLQLTVGEDLMNFVVGEKEGGIVVADHSSHASHASHSSHSSHHSGV